MKRSAWLITLVLVLAVSAATAGTDDRWLHVRVQEHGGDEETVNVNLPLEMVASVLPLIEVEEFRRGVIKIDDPEWGRIDVRGVLAELRKAPDAEFVTVRSKSESVRVWKESGFLLVTVEDADDSEKVRVRLPMDAVDALLSGGRDELNLLAAVETLGDHTDGDLVTVEDRSTTVRVWIDMNQSGI